MANKENLNIHQKLLKIADMAGVLQKNKSGFNYKYVTEEEIQAKITAGMQKYGVMLYSSLVPGTLKVEPYHYEKMKTKKVKDEKGKDVIVDYAVPVNEVIVTTEVLYTWVNVDVPEEKVLCSWAYIGQMEDAAQAFGAGATYGNRYYLLKALQLATTEADPDNYRSKQQAAEAYEDEKAQKKAEEALNKALGEVRKKGNELRGKGIDTDAILAVVAEHNNGNRNPAALATVEACNAVLEALKKLETPSTDTPVEEVKKSKKTEKKGETK